MDSNLAVSVSMSLALLETLRKLGVERPETLLQAAGIDASLLGRPENRIPFAQQQALWILAVERANTADFGLHFARYIQPASIGLPGYMAMNCRTVGDSFDFLVKYQSLAGEGGEFTLARDEGEIVLSYRAINADLAVTRHRVLAIMATTLSFGRWLVGQAYQPSRVCFTDTSDDSGCQIAEFFDCPVSFGADSNCLVFPAAVADISIANASEDLLLLLRERGDRLLATLQDYTGLASRIASQLASQLDGCVPDKAVIATQLGMSERTLQRRLQKENTSYQEVLDATRKHLALELLRNTALPAPEIATKLGFGEPSAFYRGFKKWTGSTPGQYRAASSNPE